MKYPVSSVKFPIDMKIPNLYLLELLLFFTIDIRYLIFFYRITMFRLKQPIEFKRQILMVAPSLYIIIGCQLPPCTRTTFTMHFHLKKGQEWAACTGKKIFLYVHKELATSKVLLTKSCWQCACCALH